MEFGKLLMYYCNSKKNQISDIEPGGRGRVDHGAEFSRDYGIRFSIKANG